MSAEGAACLTKGAARRANCTSVLLPPAGHRSGAAIPALPQKLPRSQLLHAVEPLPFWYSPIAQSAQLPCSGRAARVPAEQLTGTCAPSEQAEPAGHVSHADCPGCDWKRPELQRAHVACSASA